MRRPRGVHQYVRPRRHDIRQCASHQRSAWRRRLCTSAVTTITHFTPSGDSAVTGEFCSSQPMYEFAEVVVPELTDLLAGRADPEAHVLHGCIDVLEGTAAGGHRFRVTEFGYRGRRCCRHWEGIEKWELPAMTRPARNAASGPENPGRSRRECAGSKPQNAASSSSMMSLSRLDRTVRVAVSSGRILRAKNCATATLPW